MSSFGVIKPGVLELIRDYNAFNRRQFIPSTKYIVNDQVDFYIWTHAAILSDTMINGTIDKVVILRLFDKSIASADCLYNVYFVNRRGYVNGGVNPNPQHPHFSYSEMCDALKYVTDTYCNNTLHGECYTIPSCHVYSWSENFSEYMAKNFSSMKMYSSFLCTVDGNYYKITETLSFDKEDILDHDR